MKWTYIFFKLALLLDFVLLLYILLIVFGNVGLTGDAEVKSTTSVAGLSDTSSFVNGLKQGWGNYKQKYIKLLHSSHKTVKLKIICRYWNQTRISNINKM